MGPHWEQLRRPFTGDTCNAHVVRAHHGRPSATKAMDYQYATQRHDLEGSEGIMLSKGSQTQKVTVLGS